MPKVVGFYVPFKRAGFNVCTPIDYGYWHERKMNLFERVMWQIFRSFVWNAF